MRIALLRWRSGDCLMPYGIHKLTDGMVHDKLYIALEEDYVRTLNVSSARSKLPSLLGDVASKHETIIISRKGKPVAQLAPLSSDPQASSPFLLKYIAGARWQNPIRAWL